jgi:hypothetical protein
VALHNFLAQGQANVNVNVNVSAGILIAGVQTLEELKNAREMLWLNANALIDHRELKWTPMAVKPTLPTRCCAMSPLLFRTTR